MSSQGGQGGSPMGSPQGYGQSYPMNYGMPYGGSMYGSPYGGGFGSPWGGGYGSPYGGFGSPYGGYGMQGGYGSPFGGGFGSPSGGGYGMPSFGGKGQAQFTPSQQQQSQNPSQGTVPAMLPGSSGGSPYEGPALTTQPISPSNGLNVQPPADSQSGPVYTGGPPAGTVAPPSPYHPISGDMAPFPSPLTPPSPYNGPQLGGGAVPPVPTNLPPSTGIAPPGAGQGMIPNAPSLTPPSSIGTVSQGPYPAPVTTPMQPQVPPTMQSQLFNRFRLGANSSLPGIPSFGGRLGGTR